MDIGILHPGEMGSSVAASLVSTGHRVFWIAAGRSVATARRAKENGLEALDNLGELAARVDLIVAVCPPHSAIELADSVRQQGFHGIYLDANAISPGTVQLIGSGISHTADFVDGGIIGPPARQAGTTRLYLSGSRSQEVAALFRGSPLEAVCIGDTPGAASALKMCYAAWTKGSAALLMAVAALARRQDVEGAMLDEWRLSLPELPTRLDTAIQVNTPKAWRFTGEMLEIADTFQQGELPDGFHRAAAEIYQRIAQYNDDAGIDSERVLQLLSAS